MADKKQISFSILPVDEEHDPRIDKITNESVEKSKPEKFDLYAEKRKILKAKRVLRAEILKVDTVDGGTMQRFYGEATKTRRALKIEFMGSESKKSANKGMDTSIEVKFKKILEKNNLLFKEQKAIRYINTDYFLPVYNLAIEINGEYWHCDPKIYPEPKNNIQRKNIEKDRVSKEIILGQGIHRLIIWESEFKTEEAVSKLEKRFLKFLETLTDTSVISADTNDWEKNEP